MRKLVLLLLLLLCLPFHGAFAQASPFNLNIFKTQSFTASGQTGAVIQLNGLLPGTSTVGSSYASGTITVGGTAITTVSFQVMGSSDNGATFYPLPMFSVASPTSAPVTTVTATAAGLYQFNLAGLSHVKFVTTGTFTATSVTLVLTASPNASISRNGSGGSVISLTSPGGTIDIGGTSTNPTLDLDFTQAYTWAALQTFNDGLVVGPSGNLRVQGGNISVTSSGNVQTNSIQSESGNQAITINDTTGATSFASLLTLDPWVDPRSPQFGASCSNNPAIDDSTPLTNALASAQAKGEEVQVCGTCYVQHPVIWPSTALSHDLGFGMRGCSTGGTIKAAPGFPDTGTETGAMIFRAFGLGPTQQVTLHDITLDANAGTASACATFESQRLLLLDKVTCLSATGNGGGELNFGLASGSALVGLTARDIEIDNGAIVAAKGAASRPNYGLYMNRTATDGDVSNVNVNQNAIAGIYVNSGPNKFASLHPWGFSSLQGGTWPQYGIYLDAHAFGNDFINTQCDTTQLGCFFAQEGFFNAFGTVLECNDGGTGSLCAQFLAVAASGAGHIHFYGGRLQAGSLVPTGSPINWLGSVDTGSDWLVEWPTQQLGFGTSSNLIINPTLQSPNIFQPTVTGILNETGGSIHVLAAGNPATIVESTDAAGFPFFALKNATNQWLMQVGSTAGSWELQDNSTSNIVMQVAEGAPSGAVSIGTTTVTTGIPLAVTGNATASGAVISSGAATQTIQANSTSTSTFPSWEISNATNGWTGQVGGTAGSFALKDNSTSRLVMTFAEGAPAAAIAVGTTTVTTSIPLAVTGNATASGAVVSSGAATQTIQANSTSTSTFPSWEISNATNGWTGQVGGTAGSWSLKDNSTNNLVMTFAEGAPSGSISVGTSGLATIKGVNSTTFGTATNCSSSASPAVCAAAPAGSVVIVASATSVVVDTTVVTANSQILIQDDSSLGAKLGVTCNTTLAPPQVTARTAGTSFTISTAVAPSANPACYSYSIVN